MRFVRYFLFSLVIVLLSVSVSFAGQFGAPESGAKGVGDAWQVGAGYWYHQDKIDAGSKTYKYDQHQAYLQLGKAFSDFEVFARAGGSTFRIPDGFTEAYPQYPSSKSDWEPNWKPFGTIGAKAYFPVSDKLGFGAFAHGSYYFGDYEDSAVLTVSGTGVTDTLKIKNVWDAYFGLAVQVKVASAKVYAGPYYYYIEGKGQETATLGNLTFTGPEATVKNKTNFGGFLGVEVPLNKAFSFNLEGQYSERLSVGAAVMYSF